MIQETQTSKNKPALTSDRWHVVHARWSGNQEGTPLFDRAIVSEHDGRDAALASGAALKTSLEAEMAAQAEEHRDQVLVRKPSYKSLKTSPRLTRRES